MCGLVFGVGHPSGRVLSPSASASQPQGPCQPRLHLLGCENPLLTQVDVTCALPGGALVEKNSKGGRVFAAHPALLQGARAGSRGVERSEAGPLLPRRKHRREGARLNPDLYTSVNS